jgi:hypothetical protein
MRHSLTLPPRLCGTVGTPCTSTFGSLSRLREGTRCVGRMVVWLSCQRMRPILQCGCVCLVEYVIWSGMQPQCILSAVDRGLNCIGVMIASFVAWNHESDGKYCLLVNSRIITAQTTLLCRSMLVDGWLCNPYPLCNLNCSVLAREEMRQAQDFGE